MRREPEDRPYPERPALIVTYGNTVRKHRPLDGDIVVLGRAPGCDVGLASPEVAPIHCVLARGLDGWRLRDCSGRAGTRVNGAEVANGLLKDGDTLQVGTFSFEVHLPLLASAPRVAAPSTADAVRAQDIRACELTHYAEYLRRREEALSARHREADARLQQRREEIGRAESTLRAQRSEVVRLMSEMGQARQNSNAGRLAAKDREIAALVARVEELERLADPVHQQGEWARLRREQQEERAALDHEREELERLADKVKTHEREIDEGSREAELLMARERAQLARDRAELMRLRDDLRFEQQRFQRELEAGDQLEPARKVNGVSTADSGPGIASQTIIPDQGSHPKSAKWRLWHNDGD